MLCDDPIAEAAKAKREEMFGHSETCAVPSKRWLSRAPRHVTVEESLELIDMAHELLASTHEQLISASRMIRSDMPNYYAVAPLEAAAVRAVEALACVWHYSRTVGKGGCPQRPGAIIQRKVEELDLDNLMSRDYHLYGLDEGDE